VVPEMSDGRQEALPDKASAHQATRRESPGPLRGNRIGLHREGGLSCPLSRTHAGTLSSLRSFWVIRSTCASWGEGTASTTGTAMKNTRRLGIRSGRRLHRPPERLALRICRTGRQHGYSRSLREARSPIGAELRGHDRGRTADMDANYDVHYDVLVKRRPWRECGS